MIKIIQKTLILSLIFASVSCSNVYKEEMIKSGKSSAAKSRIDASQSSSDSVFKDVD